MDGLSTGYKTYSDYGDVVIYRKGGSDTVTPIIHRAMVYLVSNADGSAYMSKSLLQAPRSAWSVSPSADSWDHLTGTLTLYNVSYNHVTVTIDVGAMLRYFALQGIAPQPGFVTKGDHNAQVDQVYWGPMPVDFRWIVGVARGEIPWFGLLKLWTSNTLETPAPGNSVTDLWASLAIIFVMPIAVDIVLAMRKKATELDRAGPQSEDSHRPDKEPPGPEPPGPS